MVGQGAFLYKADLEAAFQHIAIHPDDWRFMGFEWAGRTFLDIFLPFGLCTAPRIYNLFAEAHHWILANRHASLRDLQHYLDDWLNVTSAADGLAHAVATREEFRQTTQELGFSLSEKKEEGPCHCLEFLGIELDSTAMEARLPHDKLTLLMELVSSCLTLGHTSYHNLDQLCGHFVFARSVIPIARFFQQRVWDFKQSLYHLPHTLCRRIPADTHKDLVWWLRYLPSFNSVFSICPPSPKLLVYTDASGKLGIGGYWDKVFFSEHCPKNKMAMPIHWKEM
jgi:hypothetical protein